MFLDLMDPSKVVVNDSSIIRLFDVLVGLVGHTDVQQVAAEKHYVPKFLKILNSNAETQSAKQHLNLYPSVHFMLTWTF